MMLTYRTEYIRMFDNDKDNGYNCEGIVVSMHVWYDNEPYDRKYHTYSELMIGVMPS